jgi:serine/threonine protein phosphatase PrpC
VALGRDIGENLWLILHTRFRQDLEIPLQQYGAATNIGNHRENNEDSFVSNPAEKLWIVADGMGGLGFGEVASAIAVYTISQMVKAGHGINQSIELSHKNIKEYAESENIGTNMGTTLVLLFSQGSLYNVFWVGDSRAYLYSGKLTQITRDHSLIQSLMDQGELSTAEAAVDPRKSAITRALGVQELENVRADSISEKWQRNQKILLCSDGLTDCVGDADIEKIIRESTSDQNAVDALIAKALESGGKDNVTAVLVSAPDTTTNTASDTEIPADETAGWQNQESKSLQGETHVMEQPLVQAGDTGGTIKLAPEQSPLNSTHVIPSEQFVDPSDPVPEEEQELEREGLLGDRYLLPLGLILAGLLTWILLSGNNAEQSATDPHNSTQIATGQEQDTLPDNTGLHQPDTGSKGSSMRLLAEDPLEIASESPALLRNFPSPTTGNDDPLIFQLGIFSQLAGAEVIQEKLTPFGLYPAIDKRHGENGLRFVVMLGPYSDPKVKEQVVTTLDREKITSYLKSQNKL